MATPARSDEIPGVVEAEAPETRRVRARLRLDFSLDTESGRTLLANSYQEPPLKVVRAFSLPDGSVLAHLHNVSGGLLGGDHLTQQIAIGDGAKVQLTTTGATRIYRHRSGFAPTTQRNEITVGQGALLEYLPDTTIPFAGARYRQHTSIQLAAGAGLFWWEILAPGREAGGEIFEFDELEVKDPHHRAWQNSCGGKPFLAARESGNFFACPAGALSLYRYLLYLLRGTRRRHMAELREERIRELTHDLTKAGRDSLGSKQACRPRFNYSLLGAQWPRDFAGLASALEGREAAFI